MPFFIKLFNLGTAKIGPRIEQSEKISLNEKIAEDPEYEQAVSAPCYIKHRDSV